MSNIVENPEFHRLYLIRRYKGGSLTKRYEPGRIIDIDMLDGGIRIFHVHFLYDGFSADYTAYYGLVKELSDRWIQDELKARITDAKREVQAVAKLSELVLERGISIE